MSQKRIGDGTRRFRGGHLSAFEGGVLQEVVQNHGISKLCILTQLVAEENKRQEGISNFTSKLVHFLFFPFSCVTNGGEGRGEG